MTLARRPTSLWCPLNRQSQRLLSQTNLGVTQIQTFDAVANPRKGLLNFGAFGRLTNSSYQSNELPLLVKDIQTLNPR